MEITQLHCLNYAMLHELHGEEKIVFSLSLRTIGFQPCTYLQGNLPRAPKRSCQNQTQGLDCAVNA